MADADALFQQTKAALDRGDYAAALASSEAMLTGRPGFRALMLRADIAGRMGDRYGEIEWASRAIKTEPRNARARSHLANLFNNLGEFRKALVQFERATKLGATDENTITGLAVAYEGLDDPRKARRALGPLLAQKPVPPRAAAVAMRLHLAAGEDDQAIALGRAVDAEGHPPSVGLRNVRLSLAKALERTGDVPGAFAAAEAGNATEAAPWNPDAHDALIDRFIDLFSAENLRNLPRATDSSDLPIFIIGMPRVGSTLLDRMLHAHPEIHGASEIGTLDVVPSEFSARVGGRYPECVRAMTQEHVDAHAADYLAMLHKLSPRARRVTNKELFNYAHVGLIACVTPGARIIQCTRDPVDTCLSCWMERLPQASAPFASDFQHLARYHKSYTRLIAHWKSVIDLPWLDVSYEDMVEDFEAAARRTIEFCGLDWNDACTEPHKVKRVEATLSHQQVRQPIYQGARGRSARFGALLDPLREALAS